MDERELLALIKKVVEKAGPDLRGGMALPKRARVVGVRPAGGGYTCDVQPVLNDGSPDPEAPVIPEVEIPILWSGPQRGLVCPPKAGQLCSLIFYDGDPNAPAIIGFTPPEGQAPEAGLDELSLQHSPGVKLGFEADGTIILEAPEVKIKAALVEIEGRVEVIGGLYTKAGSKGSGATISGPVKIENGSLTVQGDIKAQGNIEAQGQSDNHHKH